MSRTTNDKLQDLSPYAREAFLRYAMSVVRARAIPAVEDGLKPVHRRILFAMRDLNLEHPAPPKKSARVVGDVIGKYHPHGDGSVYSAMVLMAQPFKMRYPLIHGEGNFGFVDDPKSFAAMRYTEARMTPIAGALIDELRWDTVDYDPNFDGSLQEPRVMPGRLPFLLLTATPGIGVGMASSFLPHQINEVIEACKLLLTEKDVTLDQLMEKMPGPDFPTGGRLISPREDIRKIYAEGRGSVTLRAQWTVEHKDKGRWVLHFHELPFDVSPKKVMERIGALLSPKVKTDKEGRPKKGAVLTPEQLRLKRLFGDLIEEYKDLGENGQMDLAIFPKDKKMDPDVLARTLCAHTDLEKNIPANFVAVDPAISPHCGGILEWLTHWCNFRVQTVRRRLEDEKRRIEHRLHILAGRLLVLQDLDEAIRIIRHEDEPKQALMARFGLDDEQAEDVLEIKLRQLARLEYAKLKAEHDKLVPQLERLVKLLSHEKHIRKLIVQELDADGKAFGDTRRTELAPDSSIQAKKVMRETMADKLAPEPVALALTERGWLVWRPAKSWEEAQAAEFKVKEGDRVRRIFFGDRNDYLFLLDDAGKGYSLHLTDLPSKADALPLTTWFEPGSRKVLEGAVGNNDSRFFLATTGGFGFLLRGKNWVTRVKAGKDLLTLTEGAQPLPPQPVPVGDEATSRVVALASDGRAVAFPLADMKEFPKGKGLALMGFAKGVVFQDMVVLDEATPLVLKTLKGSATVAPKDWAEFMGERSAGKKGKALHKHSVGALFVRPGREDLVTA
jgi:topoisomerase-4 subunit A